jgi:hypothetical protein
MTTLPKRMTTTASRCCNRRRGWPASLRGGAAGGQDSRSCSSIKRNAISSSFNVRLACGAWPSWLPVASSVRTRAVLLPVSAGWRVRCLGLRSFGLLGVHDRILALSPHWLSRCRCISSSRSRRAAMAAAQASWCVSRSCKSSVGRPFMCNADRSANSEPLSRPRVKSPRGVFPVLGYRQTGVVRDERSCRQLWS